MWSKGLEIVSIRLDSVIITIFLLYQYFIKLIPWSNNPRVSVMSDFFLYVITRVSIRLKRWLFLHNSSSILDYLTRQTSYQTNILILDTITRFSTNIQFILFKFLHSKRICFWLCWKASDHCWYTCILFLVLSHFTESRSADIPVKRKLIELLF